MTSLRTDARAAAAERRAAASSRLAAFEADAPADAAVEPRRRTPSPAAGPVVADAPRMEFSRKQKPAPAPQTDTDIGDEMRDEIGRDAKTTSSAARIDAESSGPGWFGWMTAAVWFGLATGAPIAYWGLAPVLAQPPAFLAVLVALAVFPAVGLLMGVAAARDAAAARSLALRLTAERQAPAKAPDAAAWRRVRADAEDAAVAIADLLARERVAAGDVATMLKSQTEAAAQAARRQVGLMREASRLVAEETRAVETTLADAMATVTGAQSALRADVDAAEAQRARLAAAAETAGETQRLLEDTTATAFDAADAVRAAAQAAMDDARRAAEVMRSEADAARAVMHDAVNALEQAAHAARSEARAAAEADARRYDAPLPPRSAPRRPMRAAPAPVADAAPARLAAEDFGSRDTLLAHDLQLSWMTRSTSSGVDMLETMGVSLADTIADVHLAGIARRSRLGLGARRRAVIEAAPEAIELISHICDRDERVRRAAAAFRRDPGFDAAAPMDAWAIDGDVARAYLLVDAALG